MQVYATAERAEKAKDHFTMFQAIRELAPKQSKQRIMIRDAQGQLLGPCESADCIHDWYQAIYSAEPHAHSDVSLDWPFDESETFQWIEIIAHAQGAGTFVCPCANVEVWG